MKGPASVTWARGHGGELDQEDLHLDWVTSLKPCLPYFHMVLSSEFSVILWNPNECFIWVRNPVPRTFHASSITAFTTLHYNLLSLPLFHSLGPTSYLTDSTGSSVL